MLYVQVQNMIERNMLMKDIEGQPVDSVTVDAEGLDFLDLKL